MPKVLKIAHRGTSAHQPENTLVAFKKAIELGADMIELDVHICLSGELIVMHDEKVDRTTSGSGKISKMTIDQIKELTINSNVSVPLLQQVIDLTKNRCGLNIEIKDKKSTKQVCSVINKK